MSLEEKLFTSLRTIIKKMRKILDSKISVYGIGHAEMRLLMHIYSLGNCTQEELASKIEVDRSNVGRALKKLVTLGYIERIKDLEDGRIYRIILTDKGDNLRAPLQEIKRIIERAISSKITNEERKSILDILGKIELGMDENSF